MNYLEQLVSTLGGETYPEPPRRSLRPIDSMLEERTEEDGNTIFFGENNPEISTKYFLNVEKTKVVVRSILERMRVLVSSLMWLWGVFGQFLLYHSGLQCIQ